MSIRAILLHFYIKHQGRAQDLGSGYSKFLKGEFFLAPGMLVCHYADVRRLRSYAGPSYTAR